MTKTVMCFGAGRRSDFKAYLQKLNGKLKLYALPPYSPELNPDELVWDNAKQKIAKRKHSLEKGRI